MTYKQVFELAQQKGCYTYSHPENSNGGNNRQLDEELAELSEGWVGSSRELINQMRLMIIQKWLRDEHKIDVRIHTYVYNDALRSEWMVDTFTGKKSRFDGICTTHEQALLEGVAEALKLLK